jgi:DnaJ-class molecular chaperone
VDFSQIFGGAGAESPFSDLFRRFTGGAGGAGGGAGGGFRGEAPRARRAARGADVRHELEVPFRQAVQGGEARLSVQRPDGRVETITVKIPAGIADGQTIRLRGQGEQGAGGTAGDLLIRVRVAPHPYFRRAGKNLEVTVPVTLAEAVLGAKVDVPTPHGTIALKVPPNTSSGRRLRIKGHGVGGKNGPGDLFAEIQIMLPSHLDEESQQFIRQFASRYPMDPRRELKW